MKRLSAGITIATMLFLLLQLTGCGSSGSAPKKSAHTAGNTGIDYEALKKKAIAFTPEIGTSGGEFILSTVSDPKSFNPITSTETSTSEYTQYIYEGLMTINGSTLLPEPNLATSWDVSDNGLEWIFHLRSGVVWSDGAPFSAYDVEFTFNKLIYNMDISPNSPRDIFTIDKKQIAVTVIDSLTVKFTLPLQYAPFLRAMTQDILPKHRLAGIVKKGTFPTELSIKTPPDEIIGTGPYLLDSYLSSQKVVLKKNPRYWKTDKNGNRLPYIDRVVYMIVADQNAQLLQFKQGKTDYLSAKGEDYPGLKKDEQSGNYTVQRLGPSTGSNFLFFNQNTGSDSSGKPYVDPVKSAWFRNTNFRKAVAHALDKQNMINIVMNGLGYPQWSPKTPAEGYFYNSSVTEYPYDIEKAKTILKGEGFDDKNGDGILEDPKGNPVEFSFISNSGNIVRGKIAEIIRKDLENLGFKVHFQLLEFNSLVQKIDNPPFGWDAVLLGLTGGVEPHFGKNVWHSSSGLHMWFPRQKSPSTPWEKAIDSLFTIGVQELDIKKRKKIYDAWQQIASDELPLIYTVLSERIYCISTRIGNLNPAPAGLLHNFEYLYIKGE